MCGSDVVVNTGLLVFCFVSLVLGWLVACLLAVQVRMMADKGRKEEVARTRGDKDKLVALAKAWFLPFLSEVIT